MSLGRRRWYLNRKNTRRAAINNPHYASACYRQSHKVLETIAHAILNANHVYIIIGMKTFAKLLDDIRRRIEVVRGGNNFFCIPGRLHPFFEGHAKQRRKKVLIPKMRSKLNENSSFSILSNNCTGGIIYHDLNRQFSSPTINLFIPPEDFVLFVENINYYLSFDTMDEIHIGFGFPCGLLGGKIRIYFIHYRTFQDAMNAWNRRKQRFDHNNVFLVMYDSASFTRAEQYTPISNDTLFRFLSLPYNKVLFTTEKSRAKLPNVIFLKRYQHMKQSTLPFFIEILGGKRIYERYFDVVAWLNEGSRPADTRTKF